MSFVARLWGDNAKCAFVHCRRAMHASSWWRMAGTWCVDSLWLKSRHLCIDEMEGKLLYEHCKRKRTVNTVAWSFCSLIVDKILHQQGSLAQNRVCKLLVWCHFCGKRWKNITISIRWIPLMVDQRKKSWLSQSWRICMSLQTALCPNWFVILVVCHARMQVHRHEKNVHAISVESRESGRDKAYSYGKSVSIVCRKADGFPAFGSLWGCKRDKEKVGYVA